MSSFEYASESERKAWFERGLQLGKEKCIELNIEPEFAQKFIREFAQGFVQGHEQVRIETAKKLLEMNFPIKDISKVTGCTEEQILNLSKSIELSKKIDEMRRELQRRLKKSRFAHSIGVANTAVKLAKRFGVDETKAYIAGLLHDCAREFENDELPAQAELRGIKIGEVERAMPLLLHAYISAKMIKEIYGVDDAEIAQAIYRHTVGARDMNKLDKIIYFADMIEPNRNYPGVEKLRELAETAELDEILLTAFSESIIFVVQKNSLIHPDTVAARNFLLLNR